MQVWPATLGFTLYAYAFPPYTELNLILLFSAVLLLRRIMRLINTKAHGIYDYLMGMILISSPMFFGVLPGSISHKVCAAIGIAIITSGILTKYEFSLLKGISLKHHLMIDFLLGALLAVSPWALNYSDQIFKPQLVFGLSIMAVSLLSDRILTADVLQMIGKAKQSKKQQKNTGKKEAVKMPDIKFIYDSRE